MTTTPKRTAGPGRRTRSASIIADRKRAERRRKVLFQIGLGAVAATAVLATTVAVLSSQDDVADVESPPNLTSAGGMVLGSASAPVTVTVVEDFGCPHCKAFETEAAALLSGYEAGDSVRVEYRGIAFLDRAFTSDYSSRALNASACVAAKAEPQTWKNFHSALFAQQPAEGTSGLDTPTLIATAAAAGASDQATEACITDGTYRDWVEAQTDSTLGHGGVEGTPTVFVNGTKIEPASPEALDRAVRAASQQ